MTSHKIVSSLDVLKEKENAFLPIKDSNVQFPSGKAGISFNISTVCIDF